jgi:hypothetical protein
MDTRPLSPANAAIARFVSRVLDSETVWASSGEGGLARVASPSAKARMVTLLWSERNAAECWGGLVAAKAKPKPLSLADLQNDVLPKLVELNRLVGPEWGVEPLEPEIEPAELVRRLRTEAVDQFEREARRRGSVWVLQQVEGPACLMSKSRPGAQVLPCWYERAHAEARIAGPLADAVAASVPIAVFRERTLAWLADTGRLAAPGYCEGNGVIELTAADLAARLGDPSRATVNAA